MIVEAANEAQVGQVAPATERRGQGIENSGRGGRGELRIHRDDEQPGQPALLQFGENVGDRWLAVAHRQRDRDVETLLAERASQQARLALRDRE